MSRLFSRWFLLLLLALAALPGCRREVVAPGDPVAAVKGMAKPRSSDNDLVRYSRLSMPPALHKRMEATLDAEPGRRRRRRRPRSTTTMRAGWAG